MKVSTHEGSAVAASRVSSAGDSRRDNIWSVAFRPFGGADAAHPLANWDFSIVGEVDQPKRWSWDEFQALPRETITNDIHCETKWSKLDTHWEGVSLDTLLAQVAYDARYVLAFSDGGYTTNLPLEEVLGGKTWVVDTYEGQPLSPQLGGPARLLAPAPKEAHEVPLCGPVRLPGSPSVAYQNTRPLPIGSMPKRRPRPHVSLEMPGETR